MLAIEEKTLMEMEEGLKSLLDVVAEHQGVTREEAFSMIDDLTYKHGGGFTAPVIAGIIRLLLLDVPHPEGQSWRDRPPML